MGDTKLNAEPGLICASPRLSRNAREKPFKAIKGYKKQKMKNKKKEKLDKRKTPRNLVERAPSNAYDTKREGRGFESHSRYHYFHVPT